MKNELRKLIGNHEFADSKFKRRMRLHQGWWRAFVLAEEPGLHPARKDETICNTIINGREKHKNFLNQNISTVVVEAIKNRPEKSRGIIEEGRLYNNLLSSQPLAFNFFGDLKKDTTLALHILERFYPEITAVNKVVFEFAPVENYTGDNSAFDVAFEVMSGTRTGLLGLECKFTDSFSPQKYDRDAYRMIYEGSQGELYEQPYEMMIDGRFNQLFRNQLIAEALLQNGKYDFVLTGLFCHPNDLEGQKTGLEFQKMLKNGTFRFRVITYRDFIEVMQQLDLNWEQRELSMLLWARYCGMQLSEQVLD